MIGDRKLSRRYAEAAFNLAREEGLLDQMEAELAAANRLLQELPEFRALLVHPEVVREQKVRLLEQVFAGRLSPRTISFLGVLTEGGRQHLLGKVAEEFAALADQARNLVRARVASAIPLSREQATRLRAVLARRTGKRIEMQEERDASLLAGMRVWLGDEMIDGSAAGRLAELRYALEQAGRVRG